MIIGSRIELKTCQEIKTALFLCFGDQRNIDCLVRDSISLKPMPKETFNNFGAQIQDTHNLVITKLYIYNIDSAEKPVPVATDDDLAL